MNLQEFREVPQSIRQFGDALPENQQSRPSNWRRSSIVAFAIAAPLKRALTWSHFDLQKPFSWYSRSNGAASRNRSVKIEHHPRKWQDLSLSRTPSYVTLGTGSCWTHGTDSSSSFEENLNCAPFEPATGPRHAASNSRIAPNLSNFQDAPIRLQTFRASKQPYPLQTSSSCTSKG
jgi:hypothetical protein